MTEVEDEDSWLYGDSTKEKTEPEAPAISALSGKDVEKIEIDQVEKPEENTEEKEPVTENGEESTKETPKTKVKNEDEPEDGEDSDDDVQVTIGEITTGATPGSFPPQGLRTFYRNPVPVPQKTTVTKGLDMEAPGDINGTPVLETNIDLLDDKPWRKPGADISDYFNFGFSEDTWKQYCDKQKKFRGQLDNTPLISLPFPKPVQNGVSLFGTPPYIPVTKFENTVRSISTLGFSRRKEDELLAAGISSAATSTALMSRAPTSVTIAPHIAIPRPATTQVYLPGLRPPVSGTLPSTPLPFPPINPNQPPPALPIGVPPPGFLVPGVPPPGMPMPGIVPPPEYLQSLAYPPGMQPPIAHAPPPFYPQPEGEPRYGQYDDRHGRPSDSEADRHSEEDSRYRRERGSSSRRDYDRDRYSRRERDYRESRGRDRERDRERDRDKDRDREKDHDRDREKDRERGERDRERDRDKDRDRERERSQRESSSSRRYKEESPSRRRRKHEDDERHSSKHKKAKKHKHKEKDSDAPPGTDDGVISDEQGK